MKKSCISIIITLLFISVSIIFFTNSNAIAHPKLKTANDKLSPESRFSPYFNKHGLDIKDMTRVLSAIREIKQFILSDSEDDFTRLAKDLNELLESSSINLQAELKHYVLSDTEKTIPYVTLNFNKIGKEINILFLESDTPYNDKELAELGITEEDKHQLDFPGFEGTWFTHYSLNNFSEIDKQLDQINSSVFNDLSSKNQRRAALKIEKLSFLNIINPLPSRKDAYNDLLIKKSRIAKMIATLMITSRNYESIKIIKARAYASMTDFLQKKVNRDEVSQNWANDKLNNAKKYINEWLDPKNGIPEHIRIGLIRGMLEGRTEDILFAYSSGWRKFGTAGIRNPAVMSVHEPIKLLELDEFENNPHSPILTGPNMINSITLLQQETAIVKLIRYLQKNIDDPKLKLSPDFKQNIQRNTITIAYDSRLNGKFYAELLAAAFLRDGIEVELFDNAAGMPALVYAANRRGSVFGFLISASHSEAWFNGFKAVLGHLASQVDKSAKDMILAQREKVTYRDIVISLANPGVNLTEELRKYSNNLTWLGSAKKRAMDYLNDSFVPFYPAYYAHVKSRSHVSLLPERIKKLIESVRKITRLLYSAFHGVGAVPAGNFPGFLNDSGYSEVDIVNEQTSAMNGRFPGHYMPDPGVIRGWLVNLVDYLIQYVLSPQAPSVTGKPLPADESLKKPAVVEKTAPVYFFGTDLKGANLTEGDTTMKDLLGGKGANLAQMSKLTDTEGRPIKVPPGFTITTEEAQKYFDNNSQLSKEVIAAIVENLLKLETATGRQLGGKEKPLLLSVRSGARISMPGMMDTVLNIGLNDETVELLAKEFGNERFAWDSYRRLIMMFGEVVMGVDSEGFSDIFDMKKQEKGYELDTQLTVDDLKEIVNDFKDYIKVETASEETPEGKEFPQDPKEQLDLAIQAVFDSSTNQRAKDYRRINNIPPDTLSAVNVQSMVFGNLNDNSATGVAFTRDPATGEKKFYGEFLINAQGEDVVAGTRTPLPLNIEGKEEFLREHPEYEGRESEIKTLEEEMPVIYNQLVSTYHALELFYKDMQDIEFTIQDGVLYLLQTRNGKRTALSALHVLMDLVDEEIIDKEEAVLRLSPSQVDDFLHPVFDPVDKEKAKTEGRLLTKGLDASPGAAVGQIVFNPSKAEELKKEGIPVILVRTETSPEDIGGMEAAQGILTARGGKTSHAAVVARGWGKTAVVGAGEITINEEEGYLTVNGKRVIEGETISIDGYTGEVILGEVKKKDSIVLRGKKGETLNEEEQRLYDRYITFFEWVDEYRARVRTNAETPEDVRAAIEYFDADGIGLARTEHMFFKDRVSGENRISKFREMILSGNTDVLDDLSEFQKGDFKDILKILNGRPVTVRLLDPPLHEFLPDPKTDKGTEAIEELSEKLGIAEETIIELIKNKEEANPMAGDRGDRLLIAYPEIAKMQIRAILKAYKETRDEGISVSPIEIMIPLVGVVEEFEVFVKMTQKIADELGLKRGKNNDYLIGTMIEVPSAAITADKIAKKADFFSFGTNDLSQFTFKFSRDDAGKIVIPRYLGDILRYDPFVTIDEGVDELARIATTLGKAVNPDLKVGLCGEQGGDPESIEKTIIPAGLDYASCSPFRVPGAKLASAQKLIKDKRAKRESVEPYDLASLRTDPEVIDPVELETTEEMMSSETNIILMRKLLLETEPHLTIPVAEEIASAIQSDFENILDRNNNAFIRLFDQDLGAVFKNITDEEIQALSDELGKDPETITEIIEKIHEFNPALGNKGVRQALTGYDGIFISQIKGILGAMKTNKNYNPRIVVPLLIDYQEFNIIRDLVNELADKFEIDRERIQLGASIETPRAALQAGKIAETADFIVIDTMGLTESVLALTEEDAGSFLKTFVEKSIYTENPLEVFPQINVGRFISLAVKRAKQAKPEISIHLYGDNAKAGESTLIHGINIFVKKELQTAINKAVDILNGIELSIATDPDMDRAGMMLSLPEGSRGNVKRPLIEFAAKHIEESDAEKIPEEIKSELIKTITDFLEKRMQDKLHLTANEAWTFIMYYRLMILENSQKLSKNKLYIIEKSHVTTPGLHQVAKTFRDKGYHVYVVDTYVGFTELAKKSRDLFDIAKLAWETKNTINDLKKLSTMISKLDKANKVLKSNVPALSAGVPIIDETIEILKDIRDGNAKRSPDAITNLNIIAHTDILAGLEESNGYGEFGRWNPEKNEIEAPHISEKDGSLAAYLFAELSCYGKTQGLSPYDMFVNMNSELGQVFTSNMFLPHPGFTGNKEKEDEVEGLEKIFAVELQKKLDRGEEVRLFNGKYRVKEVLIYRDGKYDDIYLGFPEEGIRLKLETPLGSSAICTYRPSGTGDTIRDYNWIMGVVPEPGEDMEAYRQRTEEELEEMVKYFFGIENVRTGYADRSPENFFGLLTALSEAGVTRHQEMFNKVTGEDVSLTEAEQKLLEVVKDFTAKARDKGSVDSELDSARKTNRIAWQEYLSTDEARNYPNKISFFINGELAAEIPKALSIGWQASLIDYLISLIEERNILLCTIACDDAEITERVLSRKPENVKVNIHNISEVGKEKVDPGELLLTNLIEVLAGKGRPIITDQQIDDFLQNDPIARTAQADFNESLYNDPQSSGYIAPAELDDRAPRYGPTMDTAIETMEGFAVKHMGENYMDYAQPVRIFGVGIGGQAACSFQSVGIRNPHPARNMVALDSLSVNYNQHIQEALELLRKTDPTDSKTPEEVIDLLLSFKEKSKILMIAGSKSGTTDETMTNFQLSVKALIKIFSRYAYGDAIGEERAINMISKIYDGKDWFDPNNDIIGKLKQEEKDIFSIVLNRIIAATGEWDEAKQKGSRFDRLNKLFSEKDPRYALTTVWMATNLGGRFQGISPNGFLYNILMGYDVRKQLEAGRKLAVNQLMSGNKNPSKRLAALVRLTGADKVMIGIPNKSIYGKFQQGLGQLIPESLGKGKIAGHEVGLQTYAYSLPDMIMAFDNVKDEKGSRVYFLIRDDLMSESDKEAEKRIIEQQRKKGNLVVQFTLKNQSEEELSRLLQFIEDFTVWYGYFNSADAITNPQALRIKVPRDVRNSLGLENNLTPLTAYDPAKHNLEKIITGNGNLSDEEKLLKWVRDLYVPHLQPDVEAAKKLLKGSRPDFSDGIAFSFFNPGQDTPARTYDGLPIRDNDLRKSWYDDRTARTENGPVFLSESVYLGTFDYRQREIDTASLPELPGQPIDEKQIIEMLKEIKIEGRNETQYDNTRKTPQATVDYRKKSDEAHSALHTHLNSLKEVTQTSDKLENTSRELAALMLHARKNGKSINFTVYDEVGENLDVLQRFAHSIGIERLDFGPKEQHISKQLSVGGINIGLEIIVMPAKSLEKVQKSEGSNIVRDGLVPSYLHGLYSYEEMIAFAEAYDETFQNRKIEKAVIETGDLTTDEALIDFMIVLSRAQKIYEEAITPKPDKFLISIDDDTEGSMNRLTDTFRPDAEAIVSSPGKIEMAHTTFLTKNSKGKLINTKRFDHRNFSVSGALTDPLDTSDHKKATDIVAMTLAIMRSEKAMENMFTSMLAKGEVPLFDGALITKDDVATLYNIANKAKSPIIIVNAPEDLIISDDYLKFANGATAEETMESAAAILANYGLTLKDTIALISQENFKKDSWWSESLLSNFHRWAVLPKGATMWDAVNAAYVIFNGNYDQILGLYTDIFDGDKTAATAFMSENGFNKEALTESKGIDPAHFKNLDRVNDMLKAQRAIAIAA